MKHDEQVQPGTDVLELLHVAMVMLNELQCGGTLMPSFFHYVQPA
jgi:hypothetical protein